MMLFLYDCYNSDVTTA